MNIVRCPPVTMVLIRRPDLRYQLGFSVQNGIVSVGLTPLPSSSPQTDTEQRLCSYYFEFHCFSNWRRSAA